MVGALDCTSRATAVLRGLAGFSLGFGLVRDFTDRVSTGRAELYQAVLGNE
jgi:hypothetical protein